MFATQEMGGAGDKGLREGTLSFLSGVVIGVASTAPAYSLAAVLGGGPAGFLNPAAPD